MNERAKAQSTNPITRLKYSRLAPQARSKTFAETNLVTDAGEAQDQSAYL